MQSWKTPTPDQADRAVSLLAQPEHQVYFFNHLENPSWLRPLDDRGWFRKPPETLHDEDGVRFPIWPASSYLIRMAKLPEAADGILSIILSMEETGNQRVNADMAEAATYLPGKLAKQIVSKAKRWLRLPYPDRLAEKVGDLVTHLAKEGECKAAVELARVLLEVLPDPGNGPKEDGAKSLLYGPEPTARFAAWEYEQIIETNLSRWVDLTGLEALTLFSKLLNRAVRLSLGSEDGLPPTDYSHIWYPIISRQRKDRYQNIKDLLVVAVSDASQRMVEKDPASLAHVLQKLESFPWDIFKRLTIDLLSKHVALAAGEVEHYLTDRQAFDRFALRREYDELARQGFGHLPPAAQSIILGWIDEGPNLKAFIESREKWSGQRPTDIETSEYGDRWRRDRLGPMALHLSPPWRERYEALVTRFGPPKDPDSQVLGGSWVGPTSPLSVRELEGMDIATLVSYLRTWTPPSGAYSPSPEGLGRILKEVIETRAASFSREAARFMGLDPTYVRFLVYGLEAAVKAQRPIEWGPVLNLAKWVIEQEREIPGRQGEYADLDPGWVWTRTAIAGLLTVGLRQELGEMPFSLRHLVWSVLQVISDDPDPAPDREESLEGTSISPVDLSINTARGAAMEGVIQYALWASRNLSTEVSKLGEKDSLREMPEVRLVLDKHLDLSQDRSLAIRSVYGRFFPWLVLLGQNWAICNLGIIFPSDEALLPYHKAAWDAYVQFCPPYNDIFAVLRHQYGQAIARLAKEPKADYHYGDPHERLAEHLVVLLLRGLVGLDPDDLIARFFSVAAPNLRSRAIAAIGRGLMDYPSPPEKITKALCALWETRFDEALSAEDREAYGQEMASFGWWYASGVLDAEWAISNLASALELAGRIEPEHLVAARLALDVQVQPLLAIRCLSLILLRDRHGWSIVRREKEARTILLAALSSEDHDVRSACADLINELGKRGCHSMRDLLPGAPGIAPMGSGWRWSKTRDQNDA